ncbi:MAG TPA: hypothetical protein VFL85_01750 [Candidatus Saccharimonadales bacterium]|nr:hypothetical protein [Candidatus Saccharimonadales bacterium]
MPGLRAFCLWYNAGTFPTFTAFWQKKPWVLFFVGVMYAGWVALLLLFLAMAYGIFTGDDNLGGMLFAMYVGVPATVFLYAVATINLILLRHNRGIHFRMSVYSFFLPVIIVALFLVLANLPFLAS